MPRENKTLPEGEYSGETTKIAHERKRKYNLVTLVKTLQDGKKYLLPSTIESVNTVYQILKKIKTENGITAKIEATPEAKIEKAKISNGQFVLVPVMEST